MKRAVFACLLALLPVACATVPPMASALVTVPPTADALQALDLREQRLRATRDWSLSGRIAVVSGKRGGSGRIDWHQQGDRYDISLAAPITRQSWRLVGGPGGARLDGLDGGPRSGADAEVLLREATGWDIPVNSLADWVRGIGLGDGEVGYSAAGLPATVRMDWRLDYGDWTEAALGDGTVRMPARVSAEKGAARVRLVVDAWQLGAAAPSDAP